MTGTHSYHGTREELIREINEVKSVVYSPVPLHEDPLEDLAIRGIWSAILEPLLIQLEKMERVSDVA